MAVGRVYPNEINRILYAPGGPIGKEARALSLQVARNAQLFAQMKLGKNPNDRPRTGKFERSFEVKVLGRSTEFQVLNRVPYAAAIEEGARPHVIRARRVSNLRFKDRTGQWRNVKMVRHPGNPAYRILQLGAITAMRQRYGTVRVY